MALRGGCGGESPAYMRFAARTARKAGRGTVSVITKVEGRVHAGKNLGLVFTK